MGKILVVAEKPSVGRDLARVLRCRERGEGFLSGEGYVVSWAVGHLVGLKEPEQIDPAWKKWQWATLPILPETLPLAVLPKTRSQFSALKGLMRDPAIDRVVCATDSGREGELIFRWIYQQAGCKKPVDRLWISSMTDEAILEGFANLKPDSAYDGLYQSALSRAEADFLVGMNGSRAYTLRYNRLLSIGRVQTPTLALICARQGEIEAFTPQIYWEVQADFGTYQGLWIDGKGNTRIDQEDVARDIARRVRGGQGVVEKVETTRKRQAPPKLFDLTELQREANRRYRMTAKQTLDTAQALYERHKLITYPRTDSRYLSHDMPGKVVSALKAASAQSELAPFAASALASPLPTPKRVFDDAKVSDHHAIIPTGKAANLETLTPAEAKVYGLIARRLVAAFLEDFVYDATEVVTACGQDRFLSRGRRIIQPGWTALEKPKSEPESALPELERGMRVPVKGAKALKKQTQPPVPYTEATLLSAMEHAGRHIQDEQLREAMRESGLGTPATRAAIIERLLKVGYITRSGQKLLPTDKGRALIAVAPEQMTSALTTGKWERALAKIARGEMDRERFMASIRRYSAFLVEHARQQAPAADFPPDPPRRRRAAVKSPARAGGAAKTGGAKTPVRASGGGAKTGGAKTGAVKTGGAKTPARASGGAAKAPARPRAARSSAPKTEK
ncbi:MAG: DNA topoisomerase III [Christensenellales bacterium]